MSRDPVTLVPRGRVIFENVSKEYRLGYRRAYLASAIPGGPGLGGGRRLKALDDVSFDVAPGESFALLGHNGAGKSTALKCLSQVTRPTTGRVRVGGRVSALIELGVGFHPDMTGLENLRFATALAGVRGSSALAAIDRAVAFAEIDDFLDTPVKRYSSGMVARIGFGIATALPGDVLVVDEVLAVGDAAFQRKCQRLLASMRQDEGRTLLFVSHNEWVVKETCERAALLSHGRVAFVGGVQEALQAYAVLQEDELIGSRQQGDGAAMRIRELRLLPEDSRRVDVGAGVDLSCVLEVDEEVQHPVVAVCLLDGAGRLIWAAYSDELAITLRSGVQGVEVRIASLLVLPGHCRLQIFAFDRAVPLVQELQSIELDVEGESPRGLEHGLVVVDAVITTHGV